MKRDYNRPSVYIADNTMSVIGQYDKGELSGRINEILDRYQEIVKRETRTVEAILTDGDIAIVAQVLGRYKWHRAADIDGPPDGLCEKVKNGPGDKAKTIAAKLKAMTYSQQVAVIEWVRRVVRNGTGGR